MASGTGAAAAPAKAQSSINALSAGRPLSGPEKSTFEPGFGRSFSDIRIHEGAQADRAARSIDADAFTDGQNVVFAEGQNTASNMAHELAHVARGDTGIRRVIKAEIDRDARDKHGRRKPFDLSYKFRHDYNVKDVDRTEDYYWSSSRIKAKSFSRKELNKEIASAMLFSNRIFKLRGKSLYVAEAQLRKHHKARRRVVYLADNIQLEFAEKSASLIGGTMGATYEEAMRRTKQEIMNANPPPAEKEGRKIFQRHLKIVMKQRAGSKEFRRAAKLALKASKDWEDGGRAGVPPFAAACFLATAFVMYTAGGKIKDDTRLRHENYGPDEDDITKTTTFTDWVPGDWGYVANTHAPQTDGEEGENFVYKGMDKFWAHSGDGNTTKTLQEILDMVAGWNSAGTAILSGRRSYPRAGLK